MAVGGGEELDFVGDLAVDQGKLDKASAGKRPSTEGEFAGGGFLRGLGATARLHPADGAGNFLSSHTCLLLQATAAAGLGSDTTKLCTKYTTY